MRACLRSQMSIFGTARIMHLPGALPHSCNAIELIDYGGYLAETNYVHMV